MMKKKSMAVAMAAVTVATSVAPAFANTLEGTIVSANDTKKLDALKSEIKGYLDTKYVDNDELLRDKDNAGQGVYTVMANIKDPATTPITEMKELDRLIAQLEEDEYINISVVYNGSNKIDGNIVDYKVENYKTEDMDDVQEAAEKLIREDAPVVEEGETRAADKSAYPVISVDRVDKDTVSIELANNKTPLVIKTGDKKLDLNIDAEKNTTKAIYKKNDLGMYLDSKGEITKDPAKYVVEGFETLKSELVSKSDAEDENLDAFDYDDTEKEFAIKANDVIAKEFKVSDLYETNIDRITSQGYKLINYIKEYNAAENKSDKITASIEDKLSLVINVPVEKKDLKAKSIAGVQDYATIKVNGTSNEVATFAAKFAAATSVDVDGITPEKASINTIGGKNRQETAIKVSKAMNTTKNVVLVSDYAIADGLAATPFAKQKEAAILLTGKDSISKDVMDEIKAITTRGAADGEGNVYLIGGDAVLSKNLETQLYNAGIEENKIERIKGKNREETSLKIAEKMTDNAEVFVTGGRAEADAMSIANIAAQKEAPILLASQNDGLSEEQVKFIETNKTATTAAYVVGGEAKVPATVEAQVKDALNDKTKEVERLKGKNRQETNAVVINEFVETLENLYVAKSDDKGLVDALPGGVLAGEANTAVVLATDELNEKQETVLTNLKNKDAEKTQIGHGIAAKVWESINAIFNK